MAVQTTAIIKPLNDQLLEVTGLALAGIPVTGATVTATLVNEFGVVVAGIVNTPMTDVSGTPGAYSALIAYTFTTPSGDYTLKVTAVSGGSHYYTEQQVSVPFLQASTNLITGALCSVPALKSWANLTATDKDSLYAKVINRFTEYAAQRCNRSSFLSATYTETVNGNGKYFISPKFAFPTNEIQTVTSVTVDGVSIPAATTAVAPGFVWDDYTVYLRNYDYSRGVQNVTITYTAGLTSIPLELEEAALETCSYWLKRREYVGQASVSINGQTITFDKTDIPLVAASVLTQYTRRH